MLGAALVPDSKLFIVVVRPLTLTPHPTLLFVCLAFCLILHSTFAMHLLLLCFLLLMHALLLLRALLLLHALSRSFCLSSLLLVLEWPRSPSAHLFLPASDVWGFSLEGASSRSGCGGVLALLCCLSSNGDGCHLATTL